VLRLAFAVAICCLIPIIGRAQDASDSAAYRALTQTPVGAVPLALPASMTGMSGGRMAVAARYGLVSFATSDYVHNVVIGGDVRLGSGRLGAAAGVYHPTCDEPRCASHFMAEASFSQRLVGLAMGRDSSSATLNIGVAVSAGLGTPDDGTLFATGQRLPITLVSSTHGVRLVPYVEPGFGTGLVRADGDTDAGLRAMFGAGVAALGLVDGLSVSAGVHRVFLRDGNWLAGLALSYTRAR
jgi:hypothetical protein